MEDLTLTQLFARMEDHLAQQDAYLREAQATNRQMDEHLTRQDAELHLLTQAMQQQLATLAAATQTLVTVTQTAETTLRESRAFWAFEREAWSQMFRMLDRRREEPQ